MNNDAMYDEPKIIVKYKQTKLTTKNEIHLYQLH